MLNVTDPRAALSCPNIAGLDLPQAEKADRLVHRLAAGLLDGDAELFNEVRQQLTALLKKYAEPVTQWNPLVLELADREMLQGRDLSRMNFSMTRLCSLEGIVSLQHCNLQNSIFLCADLSQVNLEAADMSGADCRYADFREVNLTKTILVSADLSYAKLSFADLRQADLYCAKLSGAVIKNAYLREANLRRADLRNTDLYQSDLSLARLQKADLREANLFMTDLSGARLRSADLRRAHLGFCNLKEARLPLARLDSANLTGADLTQANLQKCRLSGGWYSRACFTQAQMNFAQLDNADLNEAIGLETASLQGAQFDPDTRFPKGFKPGKHALSHAGVLSLKGVLRRVWNRLSRPAEQPTLTRNA